MARTTQRQVDVFAPPATSGGIQQVRRPLPLGATVAGYKIRFTGTFTNPAGGVTPNEDSPYGYFRSVDLVLNGGFPLRSKDGRAWRFKNLIDRAVAPNSIAPAPGASAVTSIVAELNIDLQQPGLLPPLDRAFWLDTRQLSKIELVFTFGVEADIAAGAGAALTAQSVAISSVEVADQGGALSKMQAIRYQFGSLVVGDNFALLNTLGPAYQQILIHAVSGNADPNRATSDDTVISTISLIGDNFTKYFDGIPYAQLRTENAALYKLATLGNTMPPGWAVLDFSKSKGVQDILQTARRRALVLDVNTGTAALPANAAIMYYPVNGLFVIQRAAAAPRPRVVALRAA